MASSMNSAAFLLCFVTFVSLTHGDDDQVANVVNYDDKTFALGLTNNRNFVMFYAPWCGHCKNLAPTWKELARIYNSEENSPVTIAKVDCTIYTELCALHSIIGFPTLKLFTDGGIRHTRYKGKRDLESLKTFVLQQNGGTGSEATEKTEDDAEGTLEEEEKQAEEEKLKIRAVILTDENFAEQIRKGYFFIDFYAPWCGHCKQMAPAWDELADTFNPHNRVTIAKVDCTENANTCKEYGVAGYPTLIWFQDGEKIDQYRGPRTHEALKEYVSSKLSKEALGPEQEKVPSSKTVSKVVQLTDKTFESHISSDNLVFVKFHVPWCGHCKKLAPVWEELAEAFQDQPVTVAKLDCTRYGNICKMYQVRGYPTLKLFRKGEFVQDYRSFRSFESMQRFLKKLLTGPQRDEL